MDEKTLLEKHAYFYNEINKLSELDFGIDPGVSDIDMSKTAIQMAYRDIREEKKTREFELGILEYLYYISMEMFLREWLSDNLKFGKDCLDLNLRPDNKLLKNALRIIFTHPKFLFQSEYYLKIEKELSNKEIYLKLMGFRVDLYEKSIG